MRRLSSLTWVIAALLGVGAGCIVSSPPSTATPSGAAAGAPLPSADQKPAPAPALAQPLSDALSRVTKKPFGLYVTPENSPVSPEKFRGYHCGTDFETTADEQKTDVPVSAVCDGPLALKKWATGYGGVAVQSCVLDGAPVTIIYGHLRLASVTARVGDKLAAGERFAVLGTGYGAETDGERRHLHLGIHRGAAIDIRGYVQTRAALADWIDAETFMRR